MQSLNKISILLLTIMFSFVTFALNATEAAETKFNELVVINYSKFNVTVKGVGSFIKVETVAGLDFSGIASNPKAHFNRLKIIVTDPETDEVVQEETLDLREISEDEPVWQALNWTNDEGKQQALSFSITISKIKGSVDLYFN